MTNNKLAIYLISFFALLGIFINTREVLALTNSNTFYSQVKDSGLVPGYSTVNWTDSAPVNTSVAVSVRGGNVFTPDGTWTAWSAVTKAGSLAALNGNRYYQYKVVLTYTDTSATPNFQDITFNYNYYPSSVALTSSPYNTNDETNLVGKIKWNESLPSAATIIKFQLRTAPNNAGSPGAWTTWAGPDGTATDYFSNLSSACSKTATEVTCNIPNNIEIGNGASDQWVQYKVFLETSAFQTPILLDASVVYVVNATPNVGNVVIATSTNGLIGISYETKDSDTNSGSNAPGFITPSFEYWNGAEWAPCSIFSEENNPEILDNSATSSKAVLEDATSTYRVFWNAKADYNSHYVGSAKIRVKVNDNEGANNIATAESATFVLDTKDPIVNSFVINAQSDAANNITISASEDTLSDLKIKLSNNSNLSADGLNQDSGSWVDYADHRNWIFNGAVPTIYYQIKDKYNNISNAGAIQVVKAPSQPLNIVFQDVSNAETEEWREFIAWGKIAEPDAPAAFKQYNIYRSTDGTNYSLLSTQANRTTNYIISDNLDENTTYYYRVSAEDTKGNISSYSGVISDRPDGQGGSDAVGPEISSVSMSEISSQSAKISWETDEPSNSKVYYMMADDGDFSQASYRLVSSMVDSESKLGKHIVFLDDLTPGSTYFIQVESTDPSGNKTVKKLGETGYSFDSLSGPSISNISVTDIKNNQVTINWNTDQSASSYVYYSTDSSFTNPVQRGANDDKSVHSVVLSGLQPASNYYFYVQSGTAKDKKIINGQVNYYNFLTSADNLAPTINFDSANDVVNLSDTSVRISWTTSEPATSTLEYGTDENYGHTLTNSNFNTDHSYEITNLTKGTTYKFRLKNSDTNNNTAIKSGLEFTTSDSSDIVPPSISEVAAANIYDTTAVITWKTNEAANSRINYGTSSGAFASSSLSSSLNLSHSLVLNNLAAKTKYYYQVSSADASNNSTTSAEFNFTTLEALSSETDVSAREDAAHDAGVTEGEKKATTTVVTVSSGGGTLIIDKTDKAAPIISSVKIDPAMDEAVITWNTNELTDGLVEYGLNTSYENSSFSRLTTINHYHTLKKLSSDATYYYRITSVDTSGNISIEEIGTFKTLKNNILEELTPVSESNVLDSSSSAVSIPTIEPTAEDNEFIDILKRTIDFIKQAAKDVSLPILENSLLEQQKSLQDLASLTPRPSVISGPKIKTWDDMAVVSWETDKKTSSLVALSEEGVPLSDENRTQITGNTEVLSNDHQVILAGLKPDTTYNYQVRGANAIGAEISTKEAKFKTEAEAVKVTSYAAENIDSEATSFKWVSTLPTETSVRLTPYRNNVLSPEEASVITDSTMSTIHQINIDSFEPGVLYKVELFGKDAKGRIISQDIEAYSTTDQDLPLLIEQVKTNSALVMGDNLQVQSIISWNTSKLANSKVYYREGTSKDDNFWPLETTLDPNFVRRHLVVMTGFKSGVIYQFQVESIDSVGNKVRSKTYTILTPKQKESVFQVIMKNIEQTFGWITLMGK